MNPFAHRLAILLTLVAVPPARAARPFRDLVGINVKFAQGEPPADLPLLRQLGVRWVRDSVDWKTLEPMAGRYVPFPRAFQQRLDYYKANDIGLVFGLWYDNTAAYPNNPADPARSTDPAAYGRYAAEIARRLKASGVRFVIELYNEPHNSLKWIGGTWNGKPPCAWLDRYVAMVSQATKAVDPSVRLLVCDDMWIIHYWFLEKGLPPTIAGLGIHPYVKGAPERSAVDQDTDWVRPFDVVDADGSFRSAVDRLRDHAAAKLGRTPAIWLTEWGWEDGGMMGDRKITEDTIAAFIPRAYLAALDAGVENLCWFSLRDSVDGPMGLTRNDGTHRRSFDAFATMTATLGDCTTVQHVTGADHPTVGVQAYRLASPDGRTVLVAWDIDGTRDAWLAANGPARVTDVLGRPVDIVPGNRPRLHLGPSPLYIADGGPAAMVAPVVPAHVPPAELFP